MNLRAGLVFAVLLAGCGQTSGGTADAGTDAGSAPALSNLTLNPASVDAGRTTNVTATFQFTEPDRDLATATLSLIGPDAGALASSSLSAQGLNAQASGSAGLIFAVVPPSAGPHSVQVHVVDGAGHESNRVSAALEVR